MRRRQEAAEPSEIGRETAMYFASATLDAKTFETREEEQKSNPLSALALPLAAGATTTSPPQKPNPCQYGHK